ncbi:glycosyl hydrolase [Draconibacterium sp. IB214405]|uniref:WD40/YVTN/BNR-like repeat-containing protein n=1 Tax=Draconibacterium sp. IB214405 TaxID=3097352 RepID=UPI002A0CD61B|nr:glycosyl hydrolase [Draconibacterium sp. IB214405]MDX8341126.1 glycosyl hydrolase [Draconibacterium sp. IB214405]
MTFKTFLASISAILLLSVSFQSLGKKKEEVKLPKIDSSVYGNLKYRNIGPFRGGRSAAVCGVTDNPDLYYFGSTGGGVWKTEDAGQTWKNITDGYFGGSIGAVTVAPSDPNIIYVGGGEKTVRGNVSYGYGIWKSMDAGETWEYKALKEGQNIPRIRVHPKNPDIVYAAVLGHVFGPNKERGVYRSKDGGDNWEQVLFANEDAGAIDLIIDPFNPLVLYASTWRMRRTAYSLESGGEGSALWKSTDGGDTWTNISENKGLPKGTLGIIGITASPVKRNRLWAIVENNDGGVFRSDDAGLTWQKTNTDRNLRQRAWYYSRIYADAENAEKVYVLNVQFWVSQDGGSSFKSINTPHSDHHDLWINPNNADYMVIGDDGGAQISMDGARNFSSMMNQPTAQFYRLSADNQFPYHIYSAQQDNSTVRIASRSLGGGITEDDWEGTAGGESGFIAPDPKNPDIVYGGSYGGYLTRINHKTGEERLVDVWPDNPMGWGAKDLKYRFQWNYPIFFSIHDDNTLFTAAQVLFKTTNEGQSWEQISPDLTRNDTTKMGSSGGPITKDNTSVEYYGTIFAACESLQDKNVIWTGSDDGLIHITKDGGNNWENVTPPTSIMPEWTMINSIEPHQTEAGGVYVAATSYKNDDFTPYLYKTTNYGESWELITNGIDETHFTRVIRADKNRTGMLYAGTESGMYISFDDGELWQPFQLNLPVVPITDLLAKDNDLIVATQGRSIWILDDLTILQQLNKENIEKEFVLFDQRDSYKVGGRSYGGGNSGQNPPAGVAIDFYIKEVNDSTTAKLEILESNGQVIKTFCTDAEDKKIKEDLSLGKLTIDKGLNQFVWNLRYPNAKGFPGLIMWGGSLRGPEAVPGNYKARLTVNGSTQEKPFKLLANPNFSATDADYKEQFDLLMEIRDKITETHETIINIRAAKTQLDELNSKLDTAANKEIIEFSKSLIKQMDKIENELYQTKNRSNQDPLNYPIKLGNKLAAVGGVIASGSFKPTDQEYKVKEELTELINIQLVEFNNIKKVEIPKLNKMIWEAKIPAIQLESN